MHDLPIRSTLLLLSVLSLFGLQYAVFLPLFAKDILHSGARGFGLLMSSAGLAPFLGPCTLPRVRDYKGLARWIAVTSMTCAIGLEVFAESRIFWLSSAVLLIVGFAVTSQMTATNTLIQSRVPDELRSA